jgi:hypothetical protein
MVVYTYKPRTSSMAKVIAGVAQVVECLSLNANTSNHVVYKAKGFLVLVTFFISIS